LLYGKRRRPLTSPTTRTTAKISCTATQVMAGFALNMDYPIAAIDQRQRASVRSTNKCAAVSSPDLSKTS
jgi:hypothetical protein